MGCPAERVWRAPVKNSQSCDATAPACCHQAACIEVVRVDYCRFNRMHWPLLGPVSIACPTLLASSGLTGSAFVQQQPTAEPAHIQQLLDGLLPGDYGSEASPGPAASQRAASPPSPAALQDLPSFQPHAHSPAARPHGSNLAALLNSHHMPAIANTPAAARPKPKTAARFKQSVFSQQSGSNTKQRTTEARRRAASHSKKFSIRDTSNTGSMLAFNTTTPVKQGPPAGEQPARSPALPSGEGRVTISQSIQMLTGSPPASDWHAPIAAKKPVGQPAALPVDACVKKDYGPQWPPKQLAVPASARAEGSPMPDPGFATPAPKTHQHGHVDAVGSTTPVLDSAAAAVPTVPGRNFLASVFQEGLSDSACRTGGASRHSSALKAQGFEGRMRAILQREQQPLPSRGSKLGAASALGPPADQPAHVTLRLSISECQREGHLIKARCQPQPCQGNAPLSLPCCNGPDYLVEAGQNIFAFLHAEAWHTAGLAVHECFEVLPVWTCWQIASVSSPVILCRNVNRLAA